MLELIRELRSIQERLEILRLQMVAQVPQAEDDLGAICSTMMHQSFAVTEEMEAERYSRIVSGCWFGYAADQKPLSVRQHFKPDDQDAGCELSVAVPSEFNSTWLTLEFLIDRTDLLTKTAMSINLGIATTKKGVVSFAIKAHGPGVEPYFQTLADYQLDAYSLNVADIVPLGAAAANVPDVYDDVRILLFLPPVAGAQFNISPLKLSLL